MMLLACVGAAETMPSHGPQFSTCVRKVSPYKKGITEEYATCRSPRQIETLEGLQMQYPKEIKLKLAENYCLKKVFFVRPK